LHDKASHSYQHSTSGILLQFYLSLQGSIYFPLHSEFFHHLWVKGLEQTIAVDLSTDCIGIEALSHLTSAALKQISMAILCIKSLPIIKS
jgi:hypothetical protein